MLNSDDLQKICDDPTCIESISESGYMLINWRYYKFNLIEAKNRWKPYDTFFCTASYDAKSGTDLISEQEMSEIERRNERGNKITGLTMAYITVRGPSKSKKFIRVLGLDVHSRSLTEDFLNDHIAYMLDICRQNGVEFDKIRVTVPDNYEMVFESVFPNIKMSGKTLLFETRV